MEIKIIRATEKPLSFIGECASACYNTKLKDDNHAFRIAKHCIESGHYRNIELPDITFKVSGASARVVRELYTHIGGSPTRLQASTRYITYNDFNYYMPNMTAEQEEVYIKTMDSVKEGYRQLKELGCKNDEAGYILPLCMDTTVIVKMNVRTLENMFSQRECNRALLEFRKLMHSLKNEIINLGEEWQWIADKLFKVKCEKQGYCAEEYPCKRVKNGLMLTKVEHDEMVGQAIRGKKIKL